jgi:hypothetical protein
MTADEAQALLKKHGTLTRAAAAAGMVRSTFTRLVGTAAKPVPAMAKKGVVRSLTDFRNTYDLATIVPRKIAAGLKALGNGWLYEVEFAKEAGLTLRDLGLFRDNYAEHIVAVKDSRRAWVGSKKIAEEMRNMI